MENKDSEAPDTEHAAYLQRAKARRSRKAKHKALASELGQIEAIQEAIAYNLRVAAEQLTHERPCASCERKDQILRDLAHRVYTQSEILTHLATKVREAELKRMRNATVHTSD